jgi:hypothetical protein
VFHELYHAAYKRFWEEVLPATTDPFEMRDEFQEKFARDPGLVDAYRNRFAHHGFHPFTVWYWATYPLRYLSDTILVGQADNSLTLHVGQGRTAAGRVGDGVGVDVSPLRTTKAFNVGGVSVAKAGGHEKLARTQEHFMVEEPFTKRPRKLIREGTVTQLTNEPDFVKKMEEPHPPLLSLFPDYDYSKVGNQEFVLPLKATTVARRGRTLFKNDVEFRNYNRFGAEATITFAPDPIPEDQLKEQLPKP